MTSTDKSGRQRPRRLVTFTGAALIVLVVLGTLEAAALVYTTYLARRYGIIFYLPSTITEDYASYAARVHPVLGWPSPQGLREQQDRLAANPAASEPRPAAGAISLSVYGDSFAAGYGVEPKYAWSNVLGERLGCRIANYGVPGYGTDQAYLRFRSNAADEASVVLIGVLSENIQRNVNQLRNFISPVQQCQTKPRFVWEGGHLRLVPLPHLSPENYPDFIRNPERFLKHDYFVPGGPSGAQKLEFPYSWCIVKAHKFFYNRYILGYKSYLQFYRPDHPSRALPLTNALIEHFVKDAAARGKHPVVLIFPTHEDFGFYKENHILVYQPLIEELEKKKIEYIDLGAGLVQQLGERNYLELFLGGKYFHFNEEGNKLVAQIVYDYLTAKNYDPRISKPTRSNWNVLERIRGRSPLPGVRRRQVKGAGFHRPPE